jgi:hypothetical protein
MPAPAPARETPEESLPLEERIRQRAYEIYTLRGDNAGSELEDWLQAEAEIREADEPASEDAASAES